MRLGALVPIVTLILAAGDARAQSRPPAMAAPPQGQAPAARPSGALQQKVAPGLAAYTDEVLFGRVWPGSGLSQRDRSLVVISVLIATNKPAQLTGHLGRALSNGVTPVEASGVLTHLAFYAGWPNAVSALEVYDQVYTARKVDFAVLQVPVQALPPPAPETGPAEARVEAVAPGFSGLTREVVFGDLWRRSDLRPRDRSLITIAALAAMGDDDLLASDLRRGVALGLSREEIAQALTHLAFYAGWPKATKALTVLASLSPTLGGRP